MGKTINLTPATIQAKNTPAQGSPFLWLFEIAGRGGAPITGPEGQEVVIRLTGNNEPVFWRTDASGVDLEWTPMRVTVEAIVDDSEGNVSVTRLRMANPLGQAWEWLESSNYLDDGQVTIYVVHEGELTSPEPAFRFTAGIVTVRASWTAVEIDISPTDVTEMLVHGDFVTPTCNNVYRDARCGFIGDEGNTELGNCALTLGACLRRRDYEQDNDLPVIHPGRFTGFVATPITG